MVHKIYSYSTGTGGAILVGIGGTLPPALTTLGDLSTTTNPSFASETATESSFGGGGGGAFGIGGTPLEAPAGGGGGGEVGIGGTSVGLPGKESRFFFASRSSSVRFRRAWRASSSALWDVNEKRLEFAQLGLVGEPWWGEWEKGLLGDKLILYRIRELIKSVVDEKDIVQLVGEISC